MSTGFIRKFRTFKVWELLFSLYALHPHERSKRAKLIDKASHQLIDILVKTIRLVVSNKIPVKESHLPAIRRSGKTPHLQRHFQDDDTYKALKSGTLEKKKIALKHISIYKQLLYSIVNPSIFEEE